MLTHTHIYIYNIYAQLHKHTAHEHTGGGGVDIFEPFASIAI